MYSHPNTPGSCGRSIFRCFLAVGASLILACEARAQLSSIELDDIGFTALKIQLGDDMPTGAGVSVSQIEAGFNQPAPPYSTNYRPDPSFFPGKTFSFPSGGDTTTSGHANNVGRYMYGPGSLSPNLGVTVDNDPITVYYVNNWLGGGYLQTGNATLLPSIETNDIQNHSWVGSIGSIPPNETNVNALMRSDYAIARDDYVAVFGLANDLTSPYDDPQPALMVQSYNGITVGLSNGNHSRGTTTLDGAGRTKPDIVVSASLTSWATATVSSAASLLIETARTQPGLANGDRSFAVKAILMAGATKDEPEFAANGGWNHTSTQPLDAIYGAGELNIQNSYNILVAGEFGANTGTTVGSTGWDVGVASATISQLYFFDLTSDQASLGFTAVLTWNAVVTATEADGEYSFSTTVPNLNLRLYDADGLLLGSVLASSVSTIDNVELLYLIGLTTGRYALEVTSNTDDIEYGLAWMNVVPEPSTGLLFLCGASLVVLRRRGRALN